MPELFWQPWLGHFFHLRPSDMGSIFIGDWVAMYLDVKAQQTPKDPRL